YGRAADLLEKKLLPVFQSARIRAAYLARRFDTLRELKGRREGFGARFALALGSAAELEVLLTDKDADRPLVHAALARLEEAASHVGPAAGGVGDVDGRRAGVSGRDGAGGRRAVDLVGPAGGDRAAAGARVAAA